jgi:hypothetical protein
MILPILAVCTHVNRRLIERRHHLCPASGPSLRHPGRRSSAAYAIGRPITETMSEPELGRVAVAVIPAGCWTIGGKVVTNHCCLCRSQTRALCRWLRLVTWSPDHVNRCGAIPCGEHA